MSGAKVTDTSLQHAGQMIAASRWASTEQAAEKLIATAIPHGFVKGHDFSQADKAYQINVGLQPLQTPIAELPPSKAFFRSL